MWHEGLFILDTSVLLDAYRYSDETVEQLLDTLQKLQHRLWLPYHVALEYHRNLDSVIAQQQKPYSEAIDQIKKLRGSLASPKEHPFLEKLLYEQAEAVLPTLEEALCKKMESLLALLTENPIKERLADLFAGRVGEGFSPEQLEAIYQEGRERYGKKIPPGFSDVAKPEPHRYGDLVIWKEILRKAKVSNTPLLLITSDVKEDWFLRVSGRTIGPRPELISELRKEADIAFYLYTMPSFLEHVNQYLDTSIPQKAIEEVKSIERNPDAIVAWRLYRSADRELPLDQWEFVGESPTGNFTVSADNFEPGKYYVYATVVNAVGQETPLPGSQIKTLIVHPKVKEESTILTVRLKGEKTPPSNAVTSSGSEGGSSQ
jgi:predicted nucleic acid-binding protein